MADIKIYKNYNSYFNRTLITSEPTANTLVYSDTVNFNPNDGVNTVFVAGKQGQSYNSSGNYAFVTEDGKVTHWFILEAQRIRGGQYRLTLRRDLVRDFYNQWTNATTKINRAILSENSPYTFNYESVDFNQIKTKETPLMDDTGMAWIIGFVDKSMQDDMEIKIQGEIVADYTAESIDEIVITQGSSTYKLSEYLDQTIIDGNNAYSNVDSYMRVYTTTAGGTLSEKLPISMFKNWDVLFTIKNGYNSAAIYMIERGMGESEFIEWLGGKATQLNRPLYGSGGYYVNDAASIAGYKTLGAFNINNIVGKVFSIGTEDGGYRSYKLTRVDDSIKSVTFELSHDSGLASIWDEIFKSYPDRVTEYGGVTIGNPYYELTVPTMGVKYILEEIQGIDATFSFPSGKNRMKNKNAPFDLFCIPYADGITIQNNGTSGDSYTASKIGAMTIASDIAKCLGTNCYDVQLLPYCPMSGYIKSGNTFNMNSALSTRTTVIKGTNKTLGMLFWATSSSGTKDITLEQGIFPTNKKISDACDMYRLVSPNYSGQFEFSAAKNGGVSFVNVDYTYLPYSSYIHVNPNFGGLYGSEFNDARGLICQGDFSIMYTSDAWVNYQINNKNYSAIFDRTIQNMETNRKYEKINQVTGVVGNAISTGVSTGMQTGSVVGGIVGGALSAAGGVGDLYISDKLYSEKMSYTKDMQSLSLGNIQALPNSIAKTTAYTENNKIFPILEYYTCSEEEKRAFAFMISNYSMSVGVVGKPIQYIFNSWSYDDIQDRGYISCELIEIAGVDEDDNVISELAKELRLGVYTK